MFRWCMDPDAEQGGGAELGRGCSNPSWSRLCLNPYPVIGDDACTAEIRLTCQGEVQTRRAISQGDNNCNGNNYCGSGCSKTKSNNMATAIGSKATAVLGILHQLSDVNFTHA